MTKSKKSKKKKSRNAFAVFQACAFLLGGGTIIGLGITYFSEIGLPYNAIVLALGAYGVTVAIVYLLTGKFERLLLRAFPW